MVVAVVSIGDHWEPPLAKPLLITVHALADRLGITLERAYPLSYSLGRFYYGPSHTHVRVLASSVHTLVELVESGTPLGQAAEVLHSGGDGTYTRLNRQERIDLSWGRRRRRRWAR